MWVNLTSLPLPEEVPQPEKPSENFMDSLAELPAEPPAEPLTERGPVPSELKISGTKSGEAFFASNIWLANRNIWGRSTNHVQIFKVLENCSRSSGRFCGGDVTFLEVSIDLS